MSKHTDANGAPFTDDDIGRWAAEAGSEQGYIGKHLGPSGPGRPVSVGGARWEEILADRSAHDGEWVALPPIPRSVLVAFVAGPQHARPVPRDLESPTVRVVRVDRDGSEVRSRRRLNQGDVRGLLEEVSSYMAHVGLPAPGVFMDWAVRVPAGQTPDSVLRSIEEADTCPRVTGDPVADSLASARSVAAAASAIWGAHNPLA